MELSNSEINMILTSLSYTRRNFENTGITPHGSYPSYEFKMQRLAEIDNLINKIRRGVTNEDRTE